VHATSIFPKGLWWIQISVQIIFTWKSLQSQVVSQICSSLPERALRSCVCLQGPKGEMELALPSILDVQQVCHSAIWSGCSTLSQSCVLCFHVCASRLLFLKRQLSALVCLVLQQDGALRIYKKVESRKANEMHGLIRSVKSSLIGGAIQCVSIRSVLSCSLSPRASIDCAGHCAAAAVLQLSFCIDFCPMVQDMHSRVVQSRDHAGPLSSSANPVELFSFITSICSRLIPSARDEKSRAGVQQPSDVPWDTMTLGCYCAGRWRTTWCWGHQRAGRRR
jgi:hypothetical protein